jgi:hypothetical protein
MLVGVIHTLVSQLFLPERVIFKSLLTMQHFK